MVRLSLRDLEEAVRNPAEYRRKMSGGPSVNFFRPSYFGALRQALFRLHKPNADANQVRDYLTDRLSRFNNANRVDEMMEQFEWYVGNCQTQGLQTFEAPSRVTVPLLHRTEGSLVCSGEVSRLDLDLRPPSRYAAWMFRSSDPDDWQLELRMPLVQLAVAHKLGVHTDDITVGIYSFREHLIEARAYTLSEIVVASRRLEHLLTELGF